MKKVFLALVATGLFFNISLSFAGSDEEVNPEEVLGFSQVLFDTDEDEEVVMG